MAAVPEAFEAPLAREQYLEGEPLTHPALGDVQLETLLHLECFDGVVWVHYLDEYFGPRTRELFTGVRE
jgi:hypothetical protein